MRFRCVCQHGPAGPDGLIGTGVFWTECRSWLRTVLIVIAAILPLLALWTFVQHMQQQALLASVHAWRASAVPFGWLTAALIVAEALVLTELWLRPERNRSLYFLSDGSTWAPDGFTCLRGHDAMPYEQADIVSFEALRCEGANGRPVHRVAAYLRNGDVMHVAAGLTLVEAHKVAVQLSNALQEMRACRALQAITQGWADRPETVID